MNTYNALAYTDGADDPQYRLDQLPERWALRIDLDYPVGDKVVLLYPEDQPPEGTERMELMWQLQVAAGRGGFTITVIDADGARTNAPSLKGKRR